MASRSPRVRAKKEIADRIGHFAEFLHCLSVQLPGWVNAGNQLELAQFEHRGAVL